MYDCLLNDNLCYLLNQARRTDSPTLTVVDTPSENISKRDKYRKKKMVEISQVSKESKKSEKVRLQPEEDDKMPAEGRMRIASDVSAKTPANGVKQVSDQGAKTASEVRTQISSSKLADVVESVRLMGNNVLYRKEVQPNQYVTPDDFKIESASDNNFNELGTVPDDASSAAKKKSSISRKNSSDSLVSGKSEVTYQLEAYLQDRGSPKPKSRNTHVRKSSGDANMRAFPIILESVSNNSNETEQNNRAKVEQVENDLKDNESPKPKSRNRPARKSSGDSNVQVHLVVQDSSLSDNSKASDKTRQKVERVDSDLKENGSPRPKSRNRHSRKSSGDANTKGFPVVLKSSNDSSEAGDKIQQKTEQVETKPSKSKLSEGVAENDSSVDASKNVSG